MSLRDDFVKTVQKYNELLFVLEDVAPALPLTAKNHKLKVDIKSAAREVKKGLDKLEPQITNSVAEMKVSTKGFTKEFLEVWAIYKDYMVEQHGIYMKSRMQTYRLSLLFKLTKNDFKKAAQWLEYYMAAASPSIYPVNDFKIEEENGKTNGNTKTGLVVPWGEKK